MTVDWQELARFAIEYRDTKGFEPSTWDTAPIRLNCLLRKIARGAFEAWRRLDAKDVNVNLELLIVATVDLRGRVLSFPGDIVTDVHSKLESSRARPMCHGKDRRS